MSKKLFSAVILLVLLAVLVACETETGIAKDIVDQEPDFCVSAAQMVADYEASESAADISAAFASVRPLGSDMVRIVFAQEMQRVLRELVASGKAARLPAKSKR